VEEYRLTNRGAKGVKTMRITDKTGALVSILAVQEDADLMITNRSGIMIRLAVATMRVMGRATQGVRVIWLDEDDAIADLALIPANPADAIEGSEMDAVSGEDDSGFGEEGEIEQEEEDNSTENS